MAAPARTIETIVREACSMPYVVEVAHAVADGLMEDRTVEVNLQPGNGTRYRLLFVPLYVTHRIAPGRVVDGQEWGDRITSNPAEEESGVAVLWIGHYSAILTSWDHSWDYLADLFNAGAHDACLLSLLFREIGKKVG